MMRTDKAARDMRARIRRTLTNAGFERNSYSQADAIGQYTEKWRRETLIILCEWEENVTRATFPRELAFGRQQGEYFGLPRYAVETNAAGVVATTFGFDEHRNIAFEQYLPGQLRISVAYPTRS
jgi:hypothetical protein